MSLPSHPLVVRIPEFEASREAGAILAIARQQAAMERNDQRLQGFQEGFKAGMEAAARTVGAIEAEIGAYWAAREAELLDTVLAIAHRVIASLPPDDLLRGAAQKALAEHRHDTHLVLRIGPDGFAALQTALRDAPGLTAIEVRADPALAAGSIVLEHPRGQTEIGLLGQFRAMLLQANPA